MELSKLEKDLLKKIADIESIPIGAFNIREMEKVLLEIQLPILTLLLKQINLVLILL